MSDSTSSSSAGGTAKTSSGFGTAGIILSAAGAITSTIGAFYAADLAKTQAESQALTYEYQKNIAFINVRVAEMNAQQALLAGERQAGAVSMQYGQMKSSARASMAARGVVLGEGSAQEIIASTDLMKEVDMLTINANAVRAAEAARMQKVSIQNESLLAGTSADISRLQGGAISPWSAAGSSLISGGSQVAAQWYKYFG